ncbi:ABC-ATPase domain-containing protein, partial [Kaarinaea lacus]
GKGYKAYKDIKGIYDYPDFRLSIDHVQGDPFAAPSRVSVRIDISHAGFPASLWDKPVRRIALEDYLGRATRRAIKQFVKGRRGSGGSGEFNISTSGQQVLVRNAIIITPEYIEARIVMGLPAQGRKADGKQAVVMFMEELPKVMDAALRYHNHDAEQVRRHVDSVEDQDALRHWLDGEKLVAFVADDAILPRASGVDDRPMRKGALAFASPGSLAKTVTLPNAGDVIGMGIPEGITLIVGGGFHGKSTLLHALERGIYNHVPDDGREQVVSRPGAVKVRAEDARAISNVNISPFIDNLPFGRDTACFFTENASGSTSQAANIIEALDCGADVLLIDEDTSATNFMIRDERMQALVAKDKEPITPLIHRVRELYEKHGVSSVIVMGGSGDYFDIADTVIMMDSYEPNDVTEQAKKLAKPHHEEPGTTTPFMTANSRCPKQNALDPARGNRDIKIDTKEVGLLLYGTHRIDISQVEQLIDIGQTRAIGLMIHYFARHYADHCQNLVEGLKQVLADAEKFGLDRFSEYKIGTLALPRLHELSAAINRIREGDWR